MRYIIRPLSLMSPYLLKSRNIQPIPMPWALCSCMDAGSYGEKPGYIRPPLPNFSAMPGKSPKPKKPLFTLFHHRVQPNSNLTGWWSITGGLWNDACKAFFSIMNCRFGSNFCYQKNNQSLGQNFSGTSGLSLSW